MHIYTHTHIPTCMSTVAEHLHLACIQAHINTHTHTQIGVIHKTCTYASIHGYLITHVYIHTYLHVRQLLLNTCTIMFSTQHSQTHTNTHTHLLQYIHTYTNTTLTDTHMPPLIHTELPRMHTYTYTYTYTYLHVSQLLLNTCANLVLHKISFFCR